MDVKDTLAHRILMIEKEALLKKDFGFSEKDFEIAEKGINSCLDGLDGALFSLYERFLNKNLVGSFGQQIQEATDFTIFPTSQNNLTLVECFKDKKFDYLILDLLGYSSAGP